MRRLGPGFLFGFIVLVIGASIAINLFVDLSIPIVRSIVAVLLLAWGSRLIANAWTTRDRRRNTREVWLGDRRFVPHDLDIDARYDVVFGRGVIDLTHLAPPADDVTITVDTVLGSAIVQIDPAVAYDVQADSILGEVRTPPRSASPPGTPRLHLRLNAILGSCRLVEVPRAA